MLTLLLLADITTPGAAIPDTWAGSPDAVLAVLLATLGGLFLLQRLPGFNRLFAVIPVLAFCYFTPSVWSTLGIIPRESLLYDWAKTTLMPASLVLLTLALDLRAVLRLGRVTAIMFLATTLSVVIGGPVALWLWKAWLPPDAWQSLAYLAGSWIGGAANAIALKESVGASSAAIGPVIVVDVLVGYLWMGVLIALMPRSAWLDARLDTDPRWVDRLHVPAQTLADAGAPSQTTAHLILMLALGWGAAVIARSLTVVLMKFPALSGLQRFLGEFACMALIATTLGVLLSCTPARRWEAVGASRLGLLMLYILIACIGAGADLSHLKDSGAFLLVGFTWMLVHIGLIAVVGRLLRAPFFVVAVCSMANIGGPVSAPIVAAAYHPALAPVGVILAVLGNVLGTYAGLVCVRLCEWVAR